MNFIEIYLLTFGIDDQRNLIIQFPVYVQPKHLTASNIISNGNSTGSNYR